MKYLLLLVMCGGCAVSRIENPYTKETLTSPDGTTRISESSADWITGGSFDKLKIKK